VCSVVDHEAGSRFHVPDQRLPMGLERRLPRSGIGYEVLRRGFHGPDELVELRQTAVPSLLLQHTRALGTCRGDDGNSLRWLGRNPMQHADRVGQIVGVAFTLAKQRIAVCRATLEGEIVEQRVLQFDAGHLAVDYFMAERMFSHLAWQNMASAGYAIGVYATHVCRFASRVFPVRGSM